LSLPERDDAAAGVDFLQIKRDLVAYYLNRSKA
jgi:hypothetical protein